MKTNIFSKFNLFVLTLLVSISLTGCPESDPTQPADTTLADDKTALKVTYASGDSSGSVTQDVTLPTSGASGSSTITWSSSNPAVISNTGVVTVPSANTSVTLTATITYNRTYVAHGTSPKN